MTSTFRKTVLALCAIAIGVMFLILPLVAQEPVIIFPPPPPTQPCTPDTTQSGPGPHSCTPCCKQTQVKVTKLVKK